jgi:LmbE family N-acetylglucosaminyl deacetylase
MSRKLVVVAHPDDETLFFGGTIASQPGTTWEVACVTDGGPRSAERAQELLQACELLGVSRVHLLGFADDPGRRLDVPAVTGALLALGEYDEVLTHGPLGDYGHLHHQDVCLAVHRAFTAHTSVWAVATAIMPTRLVPLTPQAFATKAHVMATVYGDEQRRFLLALPVTAAEGFVQLTLAEVEALHAYLSGKPLDAEAIALHQPLLPFIKAGAVERSAYAFFAAYMAS